MRKEKGNISFLDEKMKKGKKERKQGKCSE